MARLFKANLSNIITNLPKKTYTIKTSPVKAIVNHINNTKIDYSNINYEKVVKEALGLDKYENAGKNVSIFDYNLIEDSGSSSNVTPTGAKGANIKNGNVIDTSRPVSQGKKYHLSESELAYLAYVAMREQGSVEGAKVELSLMVNKYERSGSRQELDDYIRNSKWFASGSRTGYYYPGKAYVEAARDVVNNGNRYVSSNVVEHDCISDITGISTGSKKNRSSYIPGKTVITNRYGAKYVFVGFAPNNGDPFGYLI